MRWPRRNLYARLFLWFCAANIATLLISVFVTERFARMAYAAEPNWATLARTASETYVDGGTAALEAWSARLRREGVDATLVEGQRNLLPRPLPPPMRHLLDKLLAEDNVILRPRPELIVAGEKVVGADGVARHLIAFRGPRPPHARIAQLLFVQIALSLLVIAALGWWVARSISGPVAALQSATRRMAAGELSTRLGPRWASDDDELSRLAADFDRMAARIEMLVAQERGVLQDLSHELRSPLARLHLLLDLARRAPSAEAAAHYDRAEREIARLDRIIGEALALSRMETQLPGMTLEPIALAVLIRGRVAESRLEADARAVVLQADLDETLATRGSAVLIERALDNLLANAIKFSDDGGAIDITLHHAGEVAEISVRDHGPGAPDDELAALFRPFFRGANAPRAEGHGLGLAIVERIARVHGGSVTAANAEGGGLRVVLALPILVE